VYEKLCRALVKDDLARALQKWLEGSKNVSISVMDFKKVRE
jgi:hypothetical protein